MTEEFLQQLKEVNPTLYQIHVFIIDVAKLGYGEIEFMVKSHDYLSKMIDIKAVKPEVKTLPKSIGKKIIITPQKGGEE